MVRDKAMIIIAVSKYGGKYGNLKGTINSASAMRAWAESDTDDRKYNVLYITDEDAPVTVHRVKTEVGAFLKNNFIDRLIVYFAGHGLARTNRETFWLLSNFHNDPDEALSVEKTKDALKTYNIGGTNDDLEYGQVSIIVDACTNLNDDSFGISGGRIAPNGGPKSEKIDFDQISSTSVGAFSLQVPMKIDGKKKPFCLFTSYLLKALNGEALEAIETENHAFKPVVTNMRLKTYLRKVIPEAALAFNEEMHPDVTPGIVPNFNFYRQFDKVPDIAKVEPSPKPALPKRRSRGGIFGNSGGLIMDPLPRTAVKSAFSINFYKHKDEYKNYIDDLGKHSDAVYDLLLLSEPKLDGQKVELSLPKTGDYKISTDKGLLAVSNPDEQQPLPIWAKNYERWMICPNYPNIVCCLFNGIGMETIYYKYLNDKWDSENSDILDISDMRYRGELDVMAHADSIRKDKHQYPHHADTAGYLYEVLGDFDNVARTAHYMARDSYVRKYETVLPFDLALLCAEKIYWKKDGDGRLEAYADLPTVEELSQARLKALKEIGRPRFTHGSFDALKSVKLWGIAPVYTRGWEILTDKDAWDLPHGIEKVAKEIEGRSLVTLSEAGMSQYCKVFGYKIWTQDGAVT